jgi:S-adenosylmethionine decarboxylase
MVLGRELIVDVEDVEDCSVLETLNGIRPLMEEIIQRCKLNVVSQCEYQFSPIGATMLYLLSESHLTIHTYPEKRACSINLYTCNPKTDLNDALDIIYGYFKQPYIIKKVMER